MNCSVHLNRGSDDIFDLVLQQSFLMLLQREKKAARSSRFVGLPLDPNVTFERVAKDLGQFTILFRSVASKNVQAVLRWSNGDIGIVAFEPGGVSLSMLSRRESCDDVFDAIVKRLATLKTENKRDDGVWVDFTNAAGSSVNRTTQFLHCPTWKEISGNYATSARHKMESLLSIKRPWQFGRMMVWHGPSGTGKTHAIRALLMAWKNDFDFVVVTDPENLAANPAYYYEVASKPSKNAHVRASGDEDVEEDFIKKRVVFILEDSADLIIKESRTSHYDKIGKLLNITDGLIGQGREDIFLVTFNEDIDSIDPAFTRPGRCLARVEFPPLSQADAQAWLDERGVKDVARGDMTLAQLYGRLTKRETNVDLVGASESGARMALR